MTSKATSPISGDYLEQTGPASLPDPVALTNALQPVWEKAGPMLSRIYELIQDHLHDSEQPVDPFNLREGWAEYMNYALAQPDKTWARQMTWWSECSLLWQNYLRRIWGETILPSPYQPAASDRRFKSQEWKDNPYFDFVKQVYLLTGQHILGSLSDFEDLDPETRQRLDFALRQYISAVSPTNFLLTNPEALRTTLESGGQNLIRGLENLIRDLERGQGELKITMADHQAFELGRNIAITPGNVVYRNDIMELIQYEASTQEVYRPPLLIIPPWINKYYILDLRPENSLVKWLTDQGHTVFMISWVNPQAGERSYHFEDYMQEGLLEALATIESRTGESQTNIIGYCIGGTLLAMTLAWLREKKQEDRVKSATFLTTLIDFADAGELKLFTTPKQIELIDMQMQQQGGILPAETIKMTFSLLRANDLIWSFVINNYLIGKDPFPFDLLYWNDDPTNLSAAMHSFYLKNMYRDNKLKNPGALNINGVDIDLTKITTPSYFLSAREDHIAPWQGTYKGLHAMGGNKRFTLADSGHIAGIVNPPAKNKYCYWTRSDIPEDPSAWLDKATEHKGSWWIDWQNWIKSHSSEKVPARKIRTSLCQAPGTYVLKKNHAGSTC